MNIWWFTKRLPDEELEAAVIPIFKKGDPRVLDNYRPISLLTTLNKLYAILIRGRLQDTADENLPATFFGFRKGKSTAEAIHVLRRIQEKAEVGHSPCHIILLDWSKAFDRVRHDKLLSRPLCRYTCTCRGPCRWVLLADPARQRARARTDRGWRGIGPTPYPGSARPWRACEASPMPQAQAHAAS